MTKKKAKKIPGPICFICNKEIKPKQLSKALEFIDKKGKVRMRHAYKTYGCNIDYKLPPPRRKSKTLNKRTYVKDSKKKYDRNKAKRNTKKEIEDNL